MTINTESNFQRLKSELLLWIVLQQVKLRIRADVLRIRVKRLIWRLKNH